MNHQRMIWRMTRRALAASASSKFKNPGEARAEAEVVFRSALGNPTLRDQELRYQLIPTLYLRWGLTGFGITILAMVPIIVSREYGIYLTAPLFVVAFFFLGAGFGLALRVPYAFADYARWCKAHRPRDWQNSNKSQPRDTDILIWGSVFALVAGWLSTGFFGN